MGTDNFSIITLKPLPAFCINLPEVSYRLRMQLHNIVK